MAGRTTIEWATDSWNPIRGCSRVSDGCTRCYAERVAARFSGPGQPYHGLARRVGTEPRWTNEVRFVEQALNAPLRWRRPRRIFVNSMSDLFHDKVEDEWIDKIFAVMALASRHTFIVLTKRIERAKSYFSAWEMGNRAWDKITELAFDIGNQVRGYHGSGGLCARPLPNVWLGVSVEDQATADQRIPILLATPAAKRLISAEPLLGPVDLAAMPFADGDPRHRWDALTGQALMYGEGVDGNPDIVVRLEKPIKPKLDWVITGGESGAQARPMHPDWARSLRDQCAAAGVSFFMKQMTKKAPIPDDLLVREFPNA